MKGVLITVLALLTLTAFSQKQPGEWYEAEEGYIIDVILIADTKASGGEMIMFPAYQGQAVYTYNVTPGKYIIDFCTLAPDIGHNSFYMFHDANNVGNYEGRVVDLDTSSTDILCQPVHVREGHSNTEFIAHLYDTITIDKSGFFDIIITGRESTALDRLILHRLDDNPPPPIDITGTIISRINNAPDTNALAATIGVHAWKFWHNGSRYITIGELKAVIDAQIPNSHFFELTGLNYDPGIFMAPVLTLGTSDIWKATIEMNRDSGESLIKVIMKLDAMPLYVAFVKPDST